VKGKFDGAPVRLPINEETAWERAQHEKFRAVGAAIRSRVVYFFGTLSGSAVNRTAGIV
jgi:hypothetical protein